MPSDIFNGDDFGIGREIMENIDAKVHCRKCMSCTDLEYYDDEDRDPCCGCISMDYAYRFTDKPPCESCVENIEDGTWPGGHAARSLSVGEGNNYSDEDKGQYNQLDKRVNGKATIGDKKLSICSETDVRTRGDTNYPSFPADASFAWDGIQKGK
jgi:chitinase